jgi:ferrous iron transport protein B
MKKITFALAGNPNTGKSTIFNALTGLNQGVGNWPGKTIEKKWGKLKYGNKEIDVIDLPGTHSLTAYSAEEKIARNFIVEQNPNVVIDIVDASNLERNLYLTSQLMELGANVVIALNMMDVAKRRGFEIDVKMLSQNLGIPIVPLVANKNQGISELIETSIAADVSGTRYRIDYGKELEKRISSLEKEIKRTDTDILKSHDSRWVAIKALEKDKEIEQKLNINISKYKTVKDELAIVNIRYELINKVVRKSTRHAFSVKSTTSDKVDRFITDKWLGIPIFLLIMYLAYQVVFLVGEPFVLFIGHALEIIATNMNSFLASINSPALISSLIIAGIVKGIGNVVVFLPNIFLLFIVIAIFEDSGYMARAALVTDRLMSTMGLHGKSSISLILAFGCNVPAVMSVRTLENEKERLLTMFLTTLVPCSARMVVFVFLAGAFFAPQIAGAVVWSLLVLSFFLIIGIGWIFRNYLLPGVRSPFVMELPPYRFPDPILVLKHAWSRSSTFLTKAGTFIFAVAVVIWVLASFPIDAQYGSADSYIGYLGQIMSPLFAPLGFDSVGTIALIFGFLAKEVMISAFGVLYGVADEGALAQTIAQSWTPLQAYAFMVFTLIYVPCLATVSIIKKESGSWKWAGFSIVYSVVLAWIVAFTVVQIGQALGFG